MSVPTSSAWLSQTHVELRSSCSFCRNCALDVPLHVIILWTYVRVIRLWYSTCVWISWPLNPYISHSYYRVHPAVVLRWDRVLRCQISPGRHCCGTIIWCICRPVGGLIGHAYPLMTGFVYRWPPLRFVATCTYRTCCLGKQAGQVSMGVEPARSSYTAP